jgi:hypothetical protein
MRAQAVTVMVAVLIFAGQAAANDKGQATANDKQVAALKQTGKAVDNLSAHISKAKIDADAQRQADASRHSLESGLKQDHPTIIIKATAHYCRVSIETAGWKLWSEARDGRVTDHGATVR